MSIIDRISSLQSSSTNHAASSSVATSGRQDGTVPTSGRSRATSLATDHASLSSVSSLLSHALSQTDVRTERVAALQSAIAAGTYHVSASAVAEKLIGTLTAA